MKELRLSIKEHRLTNSYNPTFWTYDYVQTFDFENETDIELIYEKVNLYVHTYYDYHNNSRNERSFKSASALFLDFDNKDGHDDSKVDEFLNSVFAEKYNWLFYTSKSHIPGSQECFHVVLPLEDNITDLETLRATYSALFDELGTYGLRCDTKPRDGARLIFPSLNESNCDDEHFDNFRFEFHQNAEYISKTIPEIAPEIVQDVIIQHKAQEVDESANQFITEFRKMSRSSQYKYVKSMMKYLNTYNSNSGFKFLNYNKWIACGYTLHSLFGEVNGLRLFRTLSKGHPDDSQDEIDMQFNYLYGSTDTATENLIMLIKMASSVGFNQNLYFRYYFMNKHRFSVTKSKFMYQRMVRKILDDRDFTDVPTSRAKIYDYSFRKNTRSFLLEVVDAEVHHITVRLGEMMDIMAKMLGIPREFVTTAITKGIIRRFININGVYDMIRFIKTQIIDLLQCEDGDHVKISDINNILKDIRSYVPSTIHNLMTNKNIELYMFELGIFTDKCRKRIVENGSSKQHRVFKVDRDSIILPNEIAIPKSVYYTNKQEALNTMIINNINRSVVMTC